MGILMIGTIISGDDNRLAAAVTTAKLEHQDHRLRAVALDSPGGQIAEAMKIVGRIRGMGLVTVVPDGATCASACALVFAAGTIKVVSPTAKLGVHGAANMHGEQDVQASAATTFLAQVFGRLGAPASVIGRMVVTPPANMTWLSQQEVEMFPLGIVQSIGRSEFPIILSGYDGVLERQIQAGQPLSLAHVLPSRPMPDYQSAGPVLPHTVLPSVYLSASPEHSQALIEQARQYSMGYNFGVSRLNAVCRGNTAWKRGCNGGASYRSKPYYSPDPPVLSVLVQTEVWLSSYDEQFRSKLEAGNCGNGSDPGNDGCRAGGAAWPRLERPR